MLTHLQDYISLAPKERFHLSFWLFPVGSMLYVVLLVVNQKNKNRSRFRFCDDEGAVQITRKHLGNWLESPVKPSPAFIHHQPKFLKNRKRFGYWLVSASNLIVK